MRRSEREIKEQDALEDLIRGQQLCRIAIHDSEFPYIVPLNYGYHDHALYFHCALEGRKIDLLRKNNKVGFEIDGGYELEKGKIACQWTSKYKSVVGTGKIDFIEDREAKKQSLVYLMEQHGSDLNEFVERAVDKVLILKLSIVSVTGKQSV